MAKRSRPTPQRPTPEPTAGQPIPWGTPRAGFALAALVIVTAGVWARLASHAHIVVDGRVELVPADSHYYVRLALLHLSAGAPVESDPFVAFPLGAGNYWPPFHTALVALLVGSFRDPELGAAFVGPVAAVIGLAVLAVTGRALLGARMALATLFLLALTPIAVEASAIGNADHHAHEPMLAALVLALGVGAVRGARSASWLAGLAAGGARLFTTVGFVLPPILAMGYALCAWRAPLETRPRIARVCAASGAAATVLLVLGVLAIGRPSSLDYEALSMFHPLATCALFGASAAACFWFAGERRLAARAALFALAGVFLLPQAWRALQHLGRADPLLAIIGESKPLLTNPAWAMFLLGPVLLALPVAMITAARELRRRRAPELALPLLAGVIFLAAAAQQARFAPLLAGAASVLLPLGLHALLMRMPSRAVRWARGALVLGGLGLLLVLIPPLPPRSPGPASGIRPTLRWMRANLPPAAQDPYDPEGRPAYGILAPFEYGHFIVLYAERPALASTFSQTSDHVRANRLASEILASTDEDEAYRRLLEARLRYVLRAPTVALLGIAEPSRDALFLRLQREESLGHFRPVFQSAEQRAPGRPLATVYEVVEGAVLEGSAMPGSIVTAALAGGYERRATADQDGTVRIRVSREGTYHLSGTGTGDVRITDDQVRSGERVAIEARRQ